MFSQRDAFKAVSFRLSIHDIHDLLEHLLVLGVNFAHLVVTLVDATGAEMAVLCWLLLVHMRLQVEKLVD